MPRLQAAAASDRANACEALGLLGDKKAVGPLVHALRDLDGDVRAAACEAMGRLQDPRAIPPLVSMLRDDDETVRGEAFAALLAIGQARAAALPLDLLAGEDPRNPSLQATQIVWPADLEAIKLLDESLADGDPEVRIGAAYALGALGIVGSFNALAWLLTEDPDLDVRAAAAAAIGQLGRAGDRRAETMLVQAWERVRGDGEVAVDVVRALVELGAKGAFFVFEQALHHADERVRQLATLGLAGSGDPAATPRLCRALRDPHTGVRRNAAAALARLGDPLAGDKLIQAATPDEAAEVRAAIGEALSRMPLDRVQPALTRALASQQAAERAAAAYLMGHVHDGEGLRRALQDAVPAVRKAAALSLGNAGRPADRQPLEAALGDPEWRVRVAAAEGLRRLGDPAAIPALARRAADDHPVVRNAITLAQRALEAPR
ncbi:MAG: HEAT repeat domain-containing protein [Myxococcales bacterium]|nr:HEAT repeat domain-containing protein [Myxococcales bacterium]MCB9524438.1 HEAT repeat domain-containing protein [Myxococcales bacterium]